MRETDEKPMLISGQSANEGMTIALGLPRDTASSELFLPDFSERMSAPVWAWDAAWGALYEHAAAVGCDGAVNMWTSNMQLLLGEEVRAFQALSMPELEATLAVLRSASPLPLVFWCAACAAMLKIEQAKDTAPAEHVEDQP